MKRNAGEWLKEKILDRKVEFGLHGALGLGWLIGAAFAILLAGPLQLPGPDWIVWLVLLPGVWFFGQALYKLKRGWPLRNMRKGASAEQKVGQAIEYALTRDRCAVAHNVEEIAKIGDIDHLVATPSGLWVIETKYGRVPKPEFERTLQRIASNVEGVRGWAARSRVTGCLVFANEQDQTPAPTYDWHGETIRCFGSPTLLMRELRREAVGTAASSEIAQKVWTLGKVGEPVGVSAGQREEVRGSPAGSGRSS